MEASIDSGRRGSADAGLRAAAPAEPQGVRERRARLARARDRCRDAAAAGRQDRGLRQHRGRAAGIALVHRAIRDGRAHDRGSRASATRLRHRRARRTRTRFPASGSARRRAAGGRSTSTACRSARATGSSSNHFFPADGEYQITIADLVGALWVYNLEFENTLIVTVDGVKVFETVLGGEADQKAIDQDQDPAVAAINGRVKNVRFQAKAGQQKVAVGFLRRTHAESDDRLHRLRQGFDRGIGQDRVMRVDWFEVSGPFNATGVSATPSRDKIFSCYPRGAAEELQCAEEIVANLAMRAFRRPLAEEDIAERLAYYEDGRADGGSFERGIEFALAGILASPHFLYRAEEAPAGVTAGTYRITDLELASRLSFFLWNTIPDDELRTVAVAQRAPRARDLARAGRAHARRSARRDARLELRVPMAAPRQARRPRARPNPVPALVAQQRSAAELRQGDSRCSSTACSARTAASSICSTANYTFLNESLATHYGINNVRGDRFRRVELADSARWGLLGKGARAARIVVPESHVAGAARRVRAREHHRRAAGDTARERRDESRRSRRAAASASTVREKLAAHSTNPTCHACHGSIDPLGFALENFDVDGTWRDRGSARGASRSTRSARCRTAASCTGRTACATRCCASPSASRRC